MKIHDKNIINLTGEPTKLSPASIRAEKSKLSNKSLIARGSEDGSQFSLATKGGITKAQYMFKKLNIETILAYGMLIFAIGFNLWLYKLEPTATIDPNDNAFQFALVDRTKDRKSVV